MPRLPVSGIKVALNMPDGADDMAIVEALGSSVTRALAILPRLTRIDGEDASPRDIWASLTVTDFEYALLALRIWLFGEQIACAFDCPHPNCGERVEVSFRASDVIGTVRPVQPRGVRPDPARPDWFRLEDAGAAFGCRPWAIRPRCLACRTARAVCARCASSHPICAPVSVPASNGRWNNLRRKFHARSKANAQDAGTF